MKKPALLDLLCLRDSKLTRKDHYARILCGEIFVDDHCVRDPRQRVEPGASVDYRPRRQYVSRGGQKLEGEDPGYARTFDFDFGDYDY